MAEPYAVREHPQPGRRHRHAPEVVAHLRVCAACRDEWQRHHLLLAGCVDPTLGLAASDVIDDAAAVPPEVEAHLEGCLACRVERLAYARFGQVSARPSDRLVARLRQLGRRPHSSRR